MAQTFSYKYLWHKPLAKGMSDEGVNNDSLFCLSCTGPASSVNGGMTIASLATDLTYITAAWDAGNGKVTYRFRPDLGTGMIVSDFKIVVEKTSTGLDVSDATSLTASNFRLMGIGSGPFASAIS